MAPPWVLDNLQARMSYWFNNILLLQKTLIAGDTNSDDREGHRGMAQLGDGLMGTVMLSDGLCRGLSRKQLQDACSDIRSKSFCGRIAKGLHLHKWIKISERQIHEGVQPTTLKNTVAALIGAVWLDSYDYRAVLRVMMEIGLLNHAQSCNELQDTLLMDVSSEFDTVVSPVIGIESSETSHIDGDYWSLLSEADRDADNLLQMQLMHGLSSTAALASTVNSEDTTEYTPPSSPDSFAGGTHQGQQDPLETSTRYDGSRTTATPGCSTRDLAGQAQQHLGEEQPPKSRTRSDLRVPKHNTRKNVGRRPGRPRAESPNCIIALYIKRETGKDVTSREQSFITAAMNAYQVAILRTPAPNQHSLAILATSIGDSSALLLLKEAIQGLRSPRVGDILCVDRQMPASERIRIVGRIGCCTALLKLIRWLHIVTLWEDLSQRAGDGANNFILSTPDSVTQHITKKGNPRYLARSEVAKGLSDMHSSQHDSPECNEEIPNTRLRRLGQRLGLMIRKWGQGTLLILGQALSDGQITTPTDRAFESFIAQVDVNEGVRISAISAAAHSIVQDFRQGNQSAARLRLECADEEAILQLSRLSTGFQALLQPLDEE